MPTTPFGVNDRAVSSRVSRFTASSRLSPSSRCPAGWLNTVGPSSTRSSTTRKRPSSSMMGEPAHGVILTAFGPSVRSGRRAIQMDHAPASRCKVSQFPSSDLASHQTQGRVPDRCRHASYLAVSALAYPKLQPLGRNIGAKSNGRVSWPQLRLIQKTCFCGKGEAILEHYALAQVLEGIFIRDTLHLNPIGFPGSCFVIQLN